MLSKSTHYFLSPMLRKKRAPSDPTFTDNTYRVISEEAVAMHPPYETLKLPELTQSNVVGQPWSLPDFRRHRPNESTAGFMRYNSRTNNEPLPTVTREKVANWMTWQKEEALQKPEFTKSSTSRIDFQTKAIIEPCKRHWASDRARGIVPVTLLPNEDGKQKFWKEKFSYEHCPNSRLDPTMPIRGRRHGSFVWDPIPPHEVLRYPESKVLPQDYFYSSAKVAACLNQEAPAAPTKTPQSPSRKSESPAMKPQSSSKTPAKLATEKGTVSFSQVGQSPTEVSQPPPSPLKSKSTPAVTPKPSEVQLTSESQQINAKSSDGTKCDKVQFCNESNGEMPQQDFCTGTSVLRKNSESMPARHVSPSALAAL